MLSIYSFAFVDASSTFSTLILFGLTWESFWLLPWLLGREGAIGNPEFRLLGKLEISALAGCSVMNAYYWFLVCWF